MLREDTHTRAIIPKYFHFLMHESLFMRVSKRADSRFKTKAYIEAIRQVLAYVFHGMTVDFMLDFRMHK